LFFLIVSKSLPADFVNAREEVGIHDAAGQGKATTRKSGSSGEKGLTFATPHFRAARKSFNKLGRLRFRWIVGIGGVVLDVVPAVFDAFRSTLRVKNPESVGAIAGGEKIGRLQLMFDTCFLRKCGPVERGFG